MALFVIIAHDKPDSLDLRVAHRPEHLAYMASRSDVIKLAGPYMDAKGDMAGSLLIVDTPDLAAAEAFAAADPFAKVGLFESSAVRPWRLSMGGLA